MSDNSSWWLLLPCGIVTVSLTTVIVTIVLVIRRATRPARGVLSGRSSSQVYTQSPLDAQWTPDGQGTHPGYTPDESHSGHHHHHFESHGHTLHHDSGSSSSGSDSGSSSSGDTGSSHHHHSG